MSATLVIHTSAAVSVGVRLRNRIVFVLSWVLWCVMLFQVFIGIGRHGVSTIEQLYTHWMSPNVVIGLGGTVLAVLLSWSGYHRMQARRTRRAVRPGRKAGRPDGTVVPVDVLAWYFGVDIRRLREMQLARNVVIHHHADGRIARILSARARAA